MPTAVITGATRGIGLAMAKRLLAAGWQVLGCGTQAASIQRAQQQVPQVRYFLADLTLQQDAQAFCAWVLQHAGAPDALINNTGRFMPGRLLPDSEAGAEAPRPSAQLQEMLAVNLMSSMYMIEGLVPAMVAAGRGTVVTINSVAGKLPFAKGAAYGVAKHAQLGLHRNLRAELAPLGLRAVAVLPGPTLTDSWANEPPPPEGIMQPEDVAELVFTALHMPAHTHLDDIWMVPPGGPWAP